MSTINETESVMDPLAVSIERGAAKVGVTPRHLRKHLDIEGGPIRTVRMGTRVLIPVDALRDYFKPPDAEPQAKDARTSAAKQRKAKPAR
jgi:hypothetical protein